MLSYSFNNKNKPLYEYLYDCIKSDIVSGKLKSGEKLPSKRSFAVNNGVSVITVQNAYEQLMGEGYIYALPKKGYYVSDIPVTEQLNADSVPAGADRSVPAGTDKTAQSAYIDLSDNRTASGRFPFSVWARLMRNVISEMSTELMTPSPTGGVEPLRKAIADYLRAFRGIAVSPEQIVVGAGTEYLYGLIIQLLGSDKTYCIENPGYRKLARIYKSQHIECVYASMDESGISPKELERLSADIAHISPTHHFPTGIAMPASRRYELLNWASQAKGRYIIEDDYDSEFRQSGKPAPPLMSMDGFGKVIYMNTFSKSLTPTIRISYMVLPQELTASFYERLSFYSCTVSNFEQYTLARFISEGYFEKHINRMRLFYRRQHDTVLNVLKNSQLSSKCDIIENDSGLHFILRLDTAKSDSLIKRELLDRGIHIEALSDYYIGEDPGELHEFIINYSNIDPERLIMAAAQLNDIV